MTLSQPSDTASPTAATLGPEERARMVEVLRSFGVRRASLFGSYARSEQRAESDMDLLVDLPPGASLFDVSRLGLALEDLRGRPVDLVTSFAALHPIIQERVLREQEPLL